MPNGETLDQVSEDIDAALKVPNLSKANRAILGTLRAFLPYFRQGQSDHEKVIKMWTAYVAMSWMAGILVASVLVYFFNILVDHTPP